MSESLFAELFARSLILFTLRFTLHMAHDDPLNLKTSIPVVCRQSRPRILCFYLFSEGSLCVTEVKLISVSSGMHHKLL